MKKTFSTKTLAGIAIFSAMAFILYLPWLEIPIFAGTPYKLDFSNIFSLLGGFIYGPIAGVIILLIKEVLHLTLSTSGGVGELANFLIGLSFILLPTIMYKYKKGLKSVIVFLAIACVIQTGVGIFANKFILLPFFHASEMFQSWFWFIVGLNLIKSVSDALFTVLLYKRLSRVFVVLNLKENNETVKMSYSCSDTISVAYEYAKTLKKGDVVLLFGDLGAGKTEFVKGVAKFFGVEKVTSPTYAYLNIYGDFVYHYDCYRLQNGEEAEVLGLTDYFGGENICLIEWAENIESALPKSCKRVIIEKTGENDRRIIL